MRVSAPFRLSRNGFILALVSAAFAGEAMAVAGRAEFIIGDVTVAGRDGRERPLTRGAELDNGDTVRTNSGRAQIRFTDGAYVSLQPNSEFGVNEYRYEGRTDGSERGFFGLLKGAMRTVTGAIGRINRSAYRVNTPTATVGIRGTGGVIEVLPDGSTLVIGTSGIWSLTNPAGSVDVPAGTSALAPTDPSAPPQQTSEQPSAPPAPLQVTQEITAGDQPALLSGGGYAAAIALGGALRGAGVDGGISTDATFDFQGRLTNLTLNNVAYSLGDGSHAEFGSDGILAWGRWTIPVPQQQGGLIAVDGPVLVQQAAAPAGLEFHYVVGLPTPALPTSGTATYSLLGATSPTYTDASTAPGVFSGALTVNFGAAAASMDASFNIAMPDRTFGLSAKGVPVAPTFSFTTSTVTGCQSACTGFVQGFFSGATAERAGVGYHISDFPTSVVGTAAFRKN